MKIFLYEHLTGGGLFDRPGTWSTTSSLLIEGMAMLRAVAADLSGIAGVQLTMQLDDRISPGNVPDCQIGRIGRIGSVSQHASSFRRLTGEADWTLVIAPEFDQILRKKCQTVEEHGGRLLGPSSEIVAQLGDKLATSQRLERAGVQVPEMRLLDHADRAETVLPAVLKPRFGAGSQDTHLVTTDDELARIRPEGKLATAYCAGMPVSVAALCGPHRCELLPAVTQRLSDDGRFQYLGGRLPICAELQQRAHRLVRAAVRALPHPRGYLGFDLVLGGAANGSRDFVIEVNPRLTTSYVGLRRSCRQNLAEMMLEVAMGRAVELSFSDEPIEFLPDGSVFSRAEAV